MQQFERHRVLRTIIVLSQGVLEGLGLERREQGQAGAEFHVVWAAEDPVRGLALDAVYQGRAFNQAGAEHRMGEEGLGFALLGRP